MLKKNAKKEENQPLGLLWMGGEQVGQKSGPFPSPSRFFHFFYLSGEVAKSILRKGYPESPTPSPI